MFTGSLNISLVVGIAVVLAVVVLALTGHCNFNIGAGMK